MMFLLLYDSSPDEHIQLTSPGCSEISRSHHYTRSWGGGLAAAVSPTTYARSGIPPIWTIVCICSSPPRPPSEALLHFSGYLLGQVKSSQVKSSQVKSSQVKSRSTPSWGYATAWRFQSAGIIIRTLSSPHPYAGSAAGEVCRLRYRYVGRRCTDRRSFSEAACCRN